MLIVELRGYEKWLPADEAILSREHELTHGLFVALGQFVLEAVNQVDNGAMTLANVRVVSTQFHPWTQNAPSLLVDIQLHDVDGTPEERKVRCFDVASLVRKAIVKFLRERIEQQRSAAKSGHLPVRYRQPSFGVQCRPRNGSGMTTDSAGDITQLWGDPGPLPDFNADYPTTMP